jgi:hypothetical protein
MKSDTSTEIASAATSIPVPAPTFNVTVPDVVTVPPPVKPEPAVTPTEVTVSCVCSKSRVIIKS